MTLHSKTAMPDSQRYTWNLYLVNNVEDIVVLLGLTGLILIVSIY